MSNINMLVYESLSPTTAGIIAGGLRLGGDALRYARFGSLFSPVSLGIWGGFGAVMQHRLNSLNNDLHDLQGEDHDNSLLNIGKILGAGALSSLPILGSAFSAYQASKLQDVENKIEALKGNMQPSS